MKRIVFHIILVLVGLTTWGQSNPHEVPWRNFIKYEANKIQYFGDSNALKPFHEKLDRLIFDGEGQLNIFHFGGSHIQADIWSRMMRHGFQTLSPGTEASRGVVFPMNLAKTNNAASFHVDHTGKWEYCKCTERKKDCNRGITGMMATTRDTTSSMLLTVNRNFYIARGFNALKIFHRTDSGSFDLQLTLSDTSEIVQKEIRDGYTQFTWNTEVDSVAISLKKTDSLQQDFEFYGMKMETSTPGIYYNAIGCNGADVPAYLRCNLLEKHLAISPPDLVIFSIGINDAYTTNFSKTYYKQNYRNLIERIRKVSPEVPIIFTTNNDSYYKRRYANKNGVKVQEAMKELSKELNTGYWDMFEIMGGLKSIDRWVVEGLAKRDKIHFTAPGYKIIGKLMWDAFLTDYERHLLTSSNP